MTLTELDQIVRKQEEIAELHEQLRDINAVRIYLREHESLYSKLASLTKERNDIIEQCAKVCDAMASEWLDDNDFKFAYTNCAAAIRELKETKHERD